MPETADQERLDTLLRTPRTPVKDQLVEAVLVQSLPVAEKVQRIELIDLMAEEAPRVSLPTKPRGALVREPAAPAPAPPDPVAVERETVGNWRRKLLPHAKGAGWLAFLFGHYQEILHFGVESTTLTRGLLPFSLRLSPLFRVFLSASLRDQVLPPLQQGLPLVLKTAWSVLPRLDYNLLVALQTLVEAAASLRAPEKARGWRPWVRLLDPVVPFLVVFHTAAGLSGRTLQAWSQACLKLGIADGLRAGGQESIRTLLESRSDQISLVDAVRTLATLRCHRVVKLAEFVPSEEGEYFARSSFDCSPEVQAEIDKEVQSQVKGLESVEKQQQDLKRIAYFVPPGDLLETFYQAGGRHADHVHRDDVVDPAKWGVKFLDVLAEAVAPLLTGSVKLEQGGSVVLLKNAALASALEQLATLKEQLLVPPSIRPRGLVEEAARVLTGLGKTLVVVIRNRSQTADPLARSADPSQLVDPLPHEDERLAHPLEWAGLTVMEALVRAARVCLLAGRFLGDTSVEASLAKAETLRETALAALDRVERLASPAQTATLRERFAALLDEEAGEVAS